ncbi:ABC-type transport system involved in multi-copper enzyme maturation, permease component [Hathewaya proteolytica DSM 3090]|uniref:ABC-type transport system involved in multi-copper enzyme maturation, permease component n=1 Tax=Hathewaya proteolytica DSM 3090 TaxID=1121331 RepID=A0A1M6P5L3_9CLOT|nr:ABC transporter permease subunit [Hathewaya proteolytica]SHK03182.1 ABC-type transport system involved in multi-copper enzyme maturation, permease component [Hathewaya proteolytica DSM 3090]
MLTIISFELKKLFKSKKNIFSIVLIFFTVFLFTGIKDMQSELNSDEDRRNMTAEILVAEQFDLKSKLGMDTGDMVNIPGQEGEETIQAAKAKDITEIEKKELEQRLVNVEQALKSIKSEDWENFHPAYLKVLKDEVKETDENDVLYEIQKYELRKEEELAKVKLPIIQDKTSMQSSNFLRVLLQQNVLIVLVILIIMINTEVYSREMEGNTYKLLYTQSMGKNKIFFGKFIAQLIISMTSVFLALFISFIFCGVKHGFGSAVYPYILILKDKMVCITAWQRNLCELSMIALIIICTCSLCTVISNAVKNNNTGIFINICTTGFLYLATSKKFFESILYVIPFSYFNISSVMMNVSLDYHFDKFIKGQSGHFLNIPFWYESGYDLIVDPKINFCNGMICLTVISVVLILIAYKLFNRKEYN